MEEGHAGLRMCSMASLAKFRRHLPLVFDRHGCLPAGGVGGHVLGCFPAGTGSWPGRWPGDGVSYRHLQGAIVMTPNL